MFFDERFSFSVGQSKFFFRQTSNHKNNNNTFRTKFTKHAKLTFFSLKVGDPQIRTVRELSSRCTRLKRDEDVITLFQQFTFVYLLTGIRNLREMVRLSHIENILDIKKYDMTRIRVYFEGTAYYIMLYIKCASREVVVRTCEQNIDVRVWNIYFGHFLNIRSWRKLPRKKNPILIFYKPCLRGTKLFVYWGKIIGIQVVFWHFKHFWNLSEL